MCFEVEGEAVEPPRGQAAEVGDYVVMGGGSVSGRRVVEVTESNGHGCRSSESFAAVRKSR